MSEGRGNSARQSALKSCAHVTEGFPSTTHVSPEGEFAQPTDTTVKLVSMLQERIERPNLTSQMLHRHYVLRLREEHC